MHVVTFSTINSDLDFKAGFRSFIKARRSLSVQAIVGSSNLLIGVDHDVLSESHKPAFVQAAIVLLRPLVDAPGAAWPVWNAYPRLDHRSRGSDTLSSTAANQQKSRQYGGSSAHIADSGRRNLYMRVAAAHSVLTRRLLSSDLTD